jgi:hypothetical protein
VRHLLLVLVLVLLLLLVLRCWRGFLQHLLACEAPCLLI